jgi:hypothetical protein
MRISRGSGMQTDLQPRSVREFLNMPAGIVHKDNGMTGRQGLPASPKTGACRRSCKFLSENMGGHLPTSIAQSQSGATCQRPLARARSALDGLP